MNSSIKIKDKEFVPYICEEQIQEAIDRIAQQISDCYGDRQGKEPLILVITLKGAMLFGAELSKRLDMPVVWDFVKCSSYGSDMCSCGTIKFQLQESNKIEGRDVLVIEDIVDSGNTWEFLYNYFNEKKAASVRIATLAIKREIYQKDIPIDFVALELQNRFVVGYGLDYDEIGRNINGIYVLSAD